MLEKNLVYHSNFAYIMQLLVAWTTESALFCMTHPVERMPIPMRRSLSTANLYEPHGEIRTPLWFLLPLRFYVGIYFMKSAIAKVSFGLLANPELLLTYPAGAKGQGMRAVIESSNYPYGFYRMIYDALIAPHPGLFVFLVVFGLLLSGLAVLLGCFTRIACLGGLFMMLNFFFAYNVSLAAQHDVTAFATMLLVIFLTQSGRAYGADHYLQGRLPGWLV
jgi:uncharacterized membrane protein YphA (DoxX/SURF4 family)